MNPLIKTHIIQFVVMIIVGVCFNPMNMLAYRFDDLYLSLTLFYGGVLMASNMMWSHEIVHYLSIGHFNQNIFLLGLVLSGVSIYLLRSQLFVTDEQWLKRMISHHSTALTTSHNILNKTKDMEVKELANDIIEIQDDEIEFMKNFIKNNA
tara:strand:+ start:932 stop:1384 length:453 start_codon:yes stop_codon:yes gene_type:complete